MPAACFDTLGEELVTKDLVNLMDGVAPRALTSAQFLKEIRVNLEKRLGCQAV